MPIDSINPLVQTPWPPKGLVLSHDVTIVNQSDNDPLHWGMLWAMRHYAENTTRGVGF